MRPEGPDTTSIGSKAVLDPPKRKKQGTFASGGSLGETGARPKQGIQAEGIKGGK